MAASDFLKCFYEAIEEDVRINKSHISLYMALFQQWQKNNFQSPLPINRNAIMKKSKISSRNTYNRCMNELHNYGYIIYHPCSNPAFHSEVEMILLE